MLTKFAQKSERLTCLKTSKELIKYDCGKNCRKQFLPNKIFFVINHFVVQLISSAHCRDILEEVCHPFFDEAFPNLIKRNEI